MPFLPPRPHFPRRMSGQLMQSQKTPTQGTNDNFYKQGQLQPENFVRAAEGKAGKVRLRWQEGYDHSYFTMASFADDHVRHAAKYLLA